MKNKMVKIVVVVYWLSHSFVAMAILGIRNLSLPRLVSQRNIVFLTKMQSIHRNEQDRQKDMANLALHCKEVENIMRDTCKRFFLGQQLNGDDLRQRLEHSHPFPRYAVIVAIEYLNEVAHQLKEKEELITSNDRSRDIQEELQCNIQSITGQIKSRRDELLGLANEEEVFYLAHTQVLRNKE